MTKPVFVSLCTRQGPTRCEAKIEALEVNHLHDALARSEDL